MEHIGYIFGKNIQLPNYLGMMVEGEDLTETITFKMKRDEILDSLDYYLTYKNSEGAGDTLALTKELAGDILLSFVVTDAMTAVKGKMEIQVTGFTSGEVPGTDDPVWKSFVSTITIARALHPEEVQPEVPTILVQYLTQMQTLKEATENAKDAAVTAKGKAETAQGKAEQAQSASESARDTSVSNANLSSQFARGKKTNGTDVVSGEDGYHDNSKYYKELAESAKNKAEDWAEKQTAVETGKYSAKYWAEQAHQTVNSKADKVTGATSGDMATLDSSGNLVDSTIPASTILTQSDVKDNTVSQDTNKPLSANQGYLLQSEINSLKSRGRFLSLWNCVTGLPATNPSTQLPYTYNSGDYYIVSTVGGVGVTNYKPNGSSYSGVASSTVETLEIKSNDTYYYDGTNWLPLFNTAKTVSFASIAGNATDNQSIATLATDMVKHDSDLPAGAVPINASQLNGHADTYFVPKTDIINNLTDTSTNKPLSANQGKVLNDAINTLINVQGLSKFYCKLVTTTTDTIVHLRGSIYGWYFIFGQKGTLISVNSNNGGTPQATAFKEGTPISVSAVDTKEIKFDAGLYTSLMIISNGDFSAFVSST